MPVVQPQVIRRPEKQGPNPWQILLSAIQTGTNVYQAIQTAQRYKDLLELQKLEATNAGLAKVAEDVRREQVTEAERGKVQEAFISRPPSPKEQKIQQGIAKGMDLNEMIVPGPFGSIGTMARIAREVSPYLPWDIEDPHIAFNALIADHLMTRKDVQDVSAVAGAAPMLGAIAPGPRRETVRRMMAKVRNVEPDMISDDTVISDINYPELIDHRTMYMLMHQPEYMEVAIQMQMAKEMGFEGMTASEGLAIGFYKDKVGQELFRLVQSADKAIKAKAADFLFEVTWGEDGPRYDYTVDLAKLKALAENANYEVFIPPEWESAYERGELIQLHMTTTQYAELMDKLVLPMIGVQDASQWTRARMQIRENAEFALAREFHVPKWMAQIFLNGEIFNELPYSQEFGRYLTPEEVDLANYYYKMYESTLAAAHAMDISTIISNAPYRKKAENLFFMLENWLKFKDINTRDYNAFRQAVKTWVKDNDWIRQGFNDLGYIDLEKDESRFFGLLRDDYKWWAEGYRDTMVNGQMRRTPWPEGEEEPPRGGAPVQLDDMAAFTELSELYDDMNIEQRQFLWDTFQRIFIEQRGYSAKDFEKYIGKIPTNLDTSGAEGPSAEIQLRKMLADKGAQLASMNQQVAALEEQIAANVSAVTEKFDLFGGRNAETQYKEVADNAGRVATTRANALAQKDSLLAQIAKLNQEILQLTIQVDSIAGDTIPDTWPEFKEWKLNQTPGAVRKN